MNPLRRLFGPSRAEVWRQLSSEVEGHYVSGGFWKGDKVHVTHGEWTLTLDTYAVSTGNVTIVYTRMRAPYVNADGFRFSIYRKSIFSGIGKMFGMQDVEIGAEPFDSDFIVKSADESKIRALLAVEGIRALIERQREIQISVKDDEGWFGPKFPEGVDELYFSVLGVIKDVERLKALFDLFAATLDELCRMGSAYESDPHVSM
jgi:hypothetical protein